MKKLILGLALLFPIVSFADYSIFKSDEDFNYPDYYQIHVDPRLQNIDMLAFDHITEKFPMPAVPYNRDLHFGGWLRDSGVDSCLNTRGKVLIRDSSSSVTFFPNGCAVETGSWNDPYTARLHTHSKDIQIDHVVALKNAYMTGAHEWDFKKRCLYGNFLGNNFHLMSVNGKENMKKSDSTPSGYVPPNKAFTCQFVKNWLYIKLIWELRTTPKETTAIKNIVRDNNCDTQSFIVPAAELTEQREYMEHHADLCQGPSVSIEKF